MSHMPAPFSSILPRQALGFRYLNASIPIVYLEPIQRIVVQAPEPIAERWVFIKRIVLGLVDKRGL
jgi:hypothetical protein